MGHTGYVDASSQAAYERAARRADEAEMRLKEALGAIRENSVVLLHLAAVTKDETTRDILHSVHDSLTDAL